MLIIKYIYINIYIYIYFNNIRLSDFNIESIVMEIEQHYRNNSRHDVTEIIIDLILNYISEGVNMNESFILTYAAFLAAIYSIIGMEIGN